MGISGFALKWTDSHLADRFYQAACSTPPSPSWLMSHRVSPLSWCLVLSSWSIAMLITLNFSSLLHQQKVSLIASWGVKSTLNVNVVTSKYLRYILG